MKEILQKEIVGSNVIYNESCIDTLSKMDNDSIDMIFADPPFNVGKKYKGYKDNNEDYFAWCEEWIKEGFRVLKPTGTFYLMTLDKNLPETLPIMHRYGVYMNIVKWKNNSAMHNKRQYWPNSQPIIVYAKTEDYVFNTYAETRKHLEMWDKKRDARMKGQLFDYWDDIPYVYSGSIVHKEAILEPGTKKKAHLAQMPEQLPGRAIKFSTNEGDIVYDPFMGSGTTAIASVKLGRKFIGSEISEEYYKLATNRYERWKNECLF